MTAPTYRTPWRVLAVMTAAALMLALAPLTDPASAQSFIDPDDPCPPGVEVSPAPFDDRDEIASVHVLNVDCAFALDVVHGRDDGQLMPAAGTRRDQMASFIVRGLQAAGYELPAPGDAGFDDIDGNEHEDNIQILAEIDVTKGRTETRYAPAQLVSRKEMASFLVRAAEYAYGDDDLQATTGVVFDDVDQDDTHADNIAAASRLLGVAEGRTETMFNPDRRTQRDQMATFIVRLIDMILLVE